MTLLHYISYFGGISTDLEMERSLLMELLKVHKIDDPDTKHSSALFTSCWYGRVNMVKLFLEFGANPLLKQKFFHNLYAITAIFRYNFTKQHYQEFKNLFIHFDLPLQQIYRQLKESQSYFLDMQISDAEIKSKLSFLKSLINYQVSQKIYSKLQSGTQYEGLFDDEEELDDFIENFCLKKVVKY